MPSEILVALISLAGTVIVAIISYVGNSAGARRAARENVEMVQYRLQELEKKVDRHNNLIERMFKVEGRVEELEHDVRDLKTKG
jgi:hypothetical protein